MAPQGLGSKLWKLAQIIASTMEKKKGSIRKFKRSYIRAKVTKFAYSKGIGGYQTSFEPFEKDEYELGYAWKIVETEFSKLPLYTKIVKEIAKTYKVSEPQAAFSLSRFAQIIATKALSGISDETLVDDVGTFVGDLEGASCVHEIVVYLRGIWLEMNEVKLYEDVVLRRPRPSDLEYEYDPFLMVSLQTRRFGGMWNPSAVLELKLRVKDDLEIHKEIASIVGALRLFKVGSVSNTQVRDIPRSILRFGSTSMPNRPPIEPYRYGIDKSNVETLRSFMANVKPLIPVDAIQGRSPEEVDHIVIAIQRYEDAILNQSTIEGRLASAIMSLEALFLKPEEKAELIHRLGLRTSKLLGLSGFEPIKVRNHLRQAYGIRSNFVHGSRIEKEDRNNAAKFLDDVLEYARVSIVTFMQLKQKEVEKEKLINLIDNSLLIEKAMKKLTGLLKNVE